MGRETKLRYIIGAIKDKASISKAALLSKPSNISIHLAVLRATTHESSEPPHEKHIAALLAFGHGSRATAAAVVVALMDRLHHTHDASVATKCLITVHHIIKRGAFILQDQLAFFPTAGGRNYLNLAGFRDGSTTTAWQLSAWVRWYAEYLETLLSASRILGFFLCSVSCSAEKDTEEEKVSALVNKDFMREIESLVAVIEGIHKMPESVHAVNNKLVLEVQALVGEDYLSAMNEVSVRVAELRERLSRLSFGESVELVCAFKRLEDCKESLSELFTRKRGLTETFWSSISEMRNEVGKVRGEEQRVALGGRGDRASESARFGDRALRSCNSFPFSSTRFASGKFA